MTTNTTEKSTSASEANQKPMTTIREGAVAASIWNRQSSAGIPYLEFSLSRSWKSKSGDKEGYSQNFFEANEEAIVQVVTQACRFIRSCQPKSAGTDVDNSSISDDQEPA